MATIVGIGMFAVIVATSVTFVFAQKKGAVVMAIYNENMVAIADNEDGATHYTTCYMTGINVSVDGKYHCAAGTTTGSSGTMYPCEGSVDPSTWSSKGYCTTD